MTTLNFRKDNRGISRKHVLDIKKSIMEHGFISHCPIVINENNEIIDGQHRYIACTELGIEPPIIKINKKDPKLMVDLNKSQKSWSINDFIKFHAENRVSSFVILKEFIRASKLSPTPAIILLTDERGFSGFDCIRDGSFALELTKTDLDNKLEMAKDIDHIAKLLKLTKGSKVLVQTYLTLIKIEGFDRDYFFTKLHRYRDRLGLCSSVKSYLQMFVQIYNLGQKTENKLPLF